MLDLIVFIKCSGVNVRIDNLADTINSFDQRNKGVNYKFYLVVDPHLESKAYDLLLASVGTEKILDFVVTENSWAVDFNIFFEKHKNSSKWLLISHDDVVYLSNDYFKKMTEAVESNIESVGWITSTSEYYYKHERKLVTDTFRAGFYKDNNKWGAMFQLHTGDIDNPDYPTRPVKIHGPMSAVMLTTMESMKKIGPCEDWSMYTMLIDEDWSLSALKNNLWNIWVPYVHHFHPNRRHLRQANNRWENEAHAGLIEKWGFDTGDPKSEGYEQGVSIPVEELREKYKGTNVAWSSYRNSFEWEYLDE